MFLLYGIVKFFEFFFLMIGGNGSVFLFLMYGVGGILEIGGGLLLVLGLFICFILFLLVG